MLAELKRKSGYYNMRINITKDDIDQLKVSVLFLKVGELREYLIKLGIPKEGKKIFLIEKLIHFLETGRIKKESPIPNKSRSKRGEEYILHPKTLILKGAYKNDAVTRDFFKSLIGEHFHFTARGIDWINEKWLSGAPPTYQQYADMWQKAYENRGSAGPSPKEEWALINFSLKFIDEHPEASRVVIMDAWKKERGRNCRIIAEILKI